MQVLLNSFAIVPLPVLVKLELVRTAGLLVFKDRFSCFTYSPISRKCFTDIVANEF